MVVQDSSRASNSSAAHLKKKNKSSLIKEKIGKHKDIIEPE